MVFGFVGNGEKGVVKKYGMEWDLWVGWNVFWLRLRCCDEL
jgi:hypothetical protein